MSLIFFVSHSHKDDRLAEAMVSFLKSGVGVETKEIRCTSQLATGLKSGARISEQLRRDIRRCEYFLPLITANSLESEFVGFEIGAAWVQEKNIVPLVYMPSGGVAIPSLLNEFLYRDVSRLEDLVQLAHDLTSEIFVKSDQSTASEILAAAKAFLLHVGAQQGAPGDAP
jgi:hypothetical protein